MSSSKPTFSLKNFRGDAPLEHWLTRIATRVGYRFWTQRKQDRDRVIALTDMAPSKTTSPETNENSDAAALLAGVLDELPPRDRLVVTLLYLEERTVAEAADLAGWSQVMVKVQAFRRLRKLLEKHAWVADYLNGEKP